MSNVWHSDDATLGYLNGPNDSSIFTVVLAPGTHEFRLTQPLLADFDLHLFNMNSGEPILIAQDVSTDNPSIVSVTGRGHCTVMVTSARGSGEFSLAYRRC